MFRIIFTFSSSSSCLAKYITRGITHSTWSPNLCPFCLQMAPSPWMDVLVVEVLLNLLCCSISMMHRVWSQFITRCPKQMIMLPDSQPGTFHLWRSGLSWATR